MKCLKFSLCGDYAFFKNPENNKGMEVSFDHIHKPALLGVLGCILGLDGRNQMNKHDGKIEYYEKLKDIKVSIVPHMSRFKIHKETINNSTGFANLDSKGKPSIQNIKRQILNNVGWDIYILKDSLSMDIYTELRFYLNNNMSRFPVYLGNNSYKANIDNVEEIDLKNIEDIDDVFYINSLYKKDILVEQFEQSYSGKPFYLGMYLPVSLSERTLYENDYMINTNLELEVKSLENIYNHKQQNLYFF